MFLNRHRPEIQLTEGAPLPNIVRFTIPLILSGVLQLLYNATDIVVVGQFEGAGSVAAVGATSSLINLIITLFMGLSIGTCVVVSQHAGAQRHKDVRQTVHTSILVSLICGVLLTVLGIFASKKLLIAMGTPASVLDGATEYMRIYSLGMPFNLLYNFGAAIMRAVGDTKRPLYYLLISGVLHTVLSIVFVTSFHMSVAGVALATVLSQVLSAILVFLSLYHAHGSIQLIPRELRISKEKLLQLARVGLPSGLQSTLFSIANVLIQSSINTFGAIAVAGNTASSNMENFVYMSMTAFYQAALSFVGQNVGARKYERIHKILLVCLGCATTAGIVTGSVCVIFSRPLISVFINSSQPAEILEQVVYYGQIRLRILCLTYFMDGIMEVLVGVLRGMGYSLVPMLVTVVGICGVRILWIYTVFAQCNSLDVLYYSYPISWVLTAGSHFIYYMHVRKSFARRATLAAAG